MEQYKEILQEILEKGTWKGSARSGMPRTISRFSIEKRFDLSKGFPLVTIKKTNASAIIHELLWFLKGDMNIKYLIDNGVDIWTKDAHKYYKRLHKVTGFDGSLDTDSFREKIKENKLSETSLSQHGYRLGDTGWTYAKMWNEYPGSRGIGINQITRLINGINNNPESRYHIVSSWHPAYVGDLDCALPPCHMLFHFNCRPISYEERVSILRKGNYPDHVKDGELVYEANVPKYYLDCKLVQRSCDTFLGVPFNIASYAILTHIIAELTNMVPGEFIWSGNDVHLYEDHISQAELILEREPKPLSTLKINSKDWGGDIRSIKAEDFVIENYQSHPYVKGDLSVGN